MQSILSVTTPAVSTDLTILATVKAEFGITGNDENANLARWISDASAIASTYCRRVFGLETVTETFRPDRWGSPSPFLILARKPVTAIASVTVDDAALGTTDYDLNAEPGHLYRNDGSGFRTDWTATKSIVVAYTAGYQPLQTLPRDIERAVIAIVRDMRADSSRDPNLKSKTTEGISSYEWWIPNEAKTVLPIEIAGLLDPYTNRTAC
jgi:hypothetical protein